MASDIGTDHGTDVSSVTLGKHHDAQHNDVVATMTDWRRCSDVGD